MLWRDRPGCRGITDVSVWMPKYVIECAVAGLTKLMDANDAGGRHSQECTLILTEGDSAKSLVVGGLSVAGRDKFGVFPLR